MSSKYPEPMFTKRCLQILCALLVFICASGGLLANGKAPVPDEPPPPPPSDPGVPSGPTTPGSNGAGSGTGSGTSEPPPPITPPPTPPPVITPGSGSSPGESRTAGPKGSNGKETFRPGGASRTRSGGIRYGSYSGGGNQGGAFRSGGDEKFTQTVLDINIRALLEGAFSGTSTGTIMIPALSAGGMLPHTDPYFGTTTVSSIPPTIVDWVQVDFRPTPMGPSVYSTVGFLREDGQVTRTDGMGKLYVDPASLAPGMYYVVVRHRNHLDIMTALDIPLSMGASPPHDFTPSQAQAFMQFQLPMNDVIPGIFHGKVSGDAIPDGDVDAVDRAEICNTLGGIGYLPGDVSLDGVVNANDLALATMNSFRITQVP